MSSRLEISERARFAICLPSARNPEVAYITMPISLATRSHTENDETCHANMLVYALYPPIRLWYEQLGMDDLLNGKDDPVFHPQADGSPVLHLVDSRWNGLSVGVP